MFYCAIAQESHKRSLCSLQEANLNITWQEIVMACKDKTILQTFRYFFVVSQSSTKWNGNGWQVSYSIWGALGTTINTWASNRLRRLISRATSIFACAFRLGSLFTTEEKRMISYPYYVSIRMTYKRPHFTNQKLSYSQLLGVETISAEALTNSGFL